MNRKLAAIAAIGSLVAGTTGIHAAEQSAENRELRLSADAMNLIRDEMREITSGVQSVTLSLATADWKSIQETSEKLRASYIMEKKLTPTLAAELERALPAQFKQLDAEFHRRAAKLGAAAADHDAELVAFHYSRLLEGCAHCHSAFASKRFPGFDSPRPQGHKH